MAPTQHTSNSKSFKIERLTPTIGAIVSGVSLAEPLTERLKSDLHQAMLDHIVLFIVDQKITPERFLAFGKEVGPLDLSTVFKPFREDMPDLQYLSFSGPSNYAAGQYRNDAWHSDSTFKKTPERGAALLPLTLPSIGGDTLWANMYAAYEALPSYIQTMIDGLEAIHALELSALKYTEDKDMGSYAGNVHPVVRVHPETGRKALFVNSIFCKRIVGMRHDEGRRLIDFLCIHAMAPEFQVRWRWRLGCVVMWDNRCALHYGVNDYTEPRRMVRVQWVGDEPVGPRQPYAIPATPISVGRGREDDIAPAN